METGPKTEDVQNTAHWLLFDGFLRLLSYVIVNHPFKMAGFFHINHKSKNGPTDILIRGMLSDEGLPK